MGIVLELGCGKSPTPGCDVYHDRVRHEPYVTVAHDLRAYPWPWVDGACDRVLALDVFEHVSAKIPTWLDECHRILAPGGVLDLRLPAWDNPLSYRDPTHLRVFHEQTFGYWDPRSELWEKFGSIYFAESPRWWHVEAVDRENGDFRYRLRKLA